MQTKTMIDIAKNVFTIESDSIIKMRDRLGVEIEQAVNLIYKCKGRVIVTGMGKSGLIGKKIAATLSSTGTPSYFLHPAESTHGDSGLLTREDVVIAISNSGETQELLNLLPVIKRFGLPIISMTGNRESTLAKIGEVVLDISVEKEACPLNKAPTASTTATLAMGDALAVCLLEKRGFSEEDFLIFHPSGTLGKGFTYKVADLMITGERLPIISQHVDFAEAVEFISEYKLGLALIVDDAKKLIGILTDGDIRRTIIKYKQLQGIKLNDVIIKSPKIVKTTDFAASALHLMEKYSITSLPVVDENNVVVGLVHIHDLLKVGVV